MKVRIGTFNLENLFLRYRMLENERGSIRKKPIDWDRAIAENKIQINFLGWNIDDFGPISKSLRKLTARVIVENDPDVLALQEVENLEALIQFNRKYLGNKYSYAMVIDGNDSRQIDVGIVSKYPFSAIRTNRFDPAGEANPKKLTFSRDCLEATVDFGSGKSITFLVNHFKSKIGGGEERRKLQATRVAEILRERFGPSLDGNFVVCGDLNCDPSAPELRPLTGLKSKGLVNVVERLPEGERWTHYYKKDKLAEQLDYLIVSKRLAEKNASTLPIIERRGLPKDIDFYTGPRFDPKLTGAQGASDHCAVFMDIVL